jgi:hypothetical protein
LNPQSLLSEFGESLMHDVRDRTLKTYQATDRGHARSAPLLALHTALTELSPEDRAVVAEIVARFVDESIFNLLSTIEANPRFDLIVRDGESECSLVEASDGLGGEMFSELGWIARFSEFGERVPF